MTKPHYVYISKETDGKRKLVIMSVQQERQELDLTFDSAMKFARDFQDAAIDLHRAQITQLGNSEKQEDLFDKTNDGISEDRPSH